jgi:hypothetical protein
MSLTYIEELNKLNQDIVLKQQKMKQLNNIIAKNDLIYQKNIEEKQKKTDRIMSIIGNMTLRRDDHLINHIFHIYKQIMIINMKIKEHSNQKAILIDHLNNLNKEIEYLTIVLNYKKE